MARKEIALLLLVVLIGFALRFYGFDQKSLWEDEIYTFNDSRDGLKEQLQFYKENPTFLHPPLFFVLTHLFYPFEHPERELRIIPLIFGTLSVPLFYLLARTFSPAIALPSALSLALMTYHVCLSQDGRSYAFLMFFGMAGIYLLMVHLKTNKRRYLLPAAFFLSLLFYTSYSSILFIVFSQVLWFYEIGEKNRKGRLLSFLMLSGLVLLFSLPWILFVLIHYKGQAWMVPFQPRVPISFWSVLYGIFHDWAPRAPLMGASALLFSLFLFFSKPRRNSLVLLAVLLLPIAGLTFFCRWFNVNHFITSRYFIHFLPLFILSLYLSLQAIEWRWESLRRRIRLTHLFVALLIASNLVIFPLYYHSEKQDFRGLVNSLKGQLREGDRIFDGEMGYTPGMLHYFGIYPEGRQYVIPFRRVSEKEIELWKSFTYQKRIFTIYAAASCCDRYVADGNRLWIVVGRWKAKKMMENPQFIFKGSFDGSVLNFDRFPSDGSMYLFLLDPRSPQK